MAAVLVRARPGRRAFTAPSGGLLIPQDKWIRVDRTSWIDRLATVHGDIEIQDTASGIRPAQLPTSPAPAPVASGSEISVSVAASPRRARARQSNE